MNLESNVILNAIVSLTMLILNIIYIIAIIRCMKNIKRTEENTRKSYYTLERIRQHQDTQYREIKQLIEKIKEKEDKITKP